MNYTVINPRMRVRTDVLFSHCYKLQAQNERGFHAVVNNCNQLCCGGLTAGVLARGPRQQLCPWEIFSQSD